jgi:sugar phosphate isomerase/epimerase
MKLSCVPVSLFDTIASGQMLPAEWMDFAAELGLDGVECAPPLIRPIGPATPAEFRRLAEARGLAISNYTAYSDFTYPDADARKSELVAVLRNIQIARDLGAPSLRVLTGQQRPEVREAEGIRWIADCIAQVVMEADKVGVRINLENHTKAFT